MPDTCPRDTCEGSIIFGTSFKCGKCGYTFSEWVEDVCQGALEQADITIHEQVADSPAFNWEDFEARR